MDKIETTSIAVEQFFGEVDYKTKVSGGCQAKKKISDDLIIKHTEDLIQRRLEGGNYCLKPLKAITKQVDSIQFEFDQRQKGLMAAGLREDEAVIVSKESQVQKVVRACKASHGGPIHTLAELDELVEANKTEESLASALNLEIRYRKFTCLLKVATNNELFKQRGISNKERITHLKQLLSDDTRPKCHATIGDIEALYEQDIVTTSSSAASRHESVARSQAEVGDWLANGCWPPNKLEEVVVLIENSFAIATVHACNEQNADVYLIKSVNVRGHPNLSHWATESTSPLVSCPKESILQLRPILSVKGKRRTLKLHLDNFDTIIQLVESFHAKPTDI